MHEEDDDIVENPKRLLVVAADHLIDHLAELLRTEHFGGVGAAVDPNDGFALSRERAGLILGDAYGVREAGGDLLVPRELLMVCGRCDDPHQMRPAFGGPA